jgi:hypothetical protein
MAEFHSNLYKFYRNVRGANDWKTFQSCFFWGTLKNQQFWAILWTKVQFEGFDGTK